MTVKEFVLETLTHATIDSINFRYGTISVYPLGYRRDVAGLVRDGHIRFDLTPGGHYTIANRPGQPHRMALPASFVEPTPSTADVGAGKVKPKLARPEVADFRGTVIHEATHALQDYQRHQTGGRTAEGAAYLAGWMARLLWGYPPLASTARRSTHHAYARYLAGRLLGNQVVYVVPAADERALNALVATAAAHHYNFNGI